MAIPLFGQAQLDAAVAAASAQIPDGHTNAIIGTVDTAGAQVVLALKLGTNDRWKATALFRHDWTGDNAGAATVVYSW